MQLLFACQSRTLFLSYFPITRQKVQNCKGFICVQASTKWQKQARATVTCFRTLANSEKAPTCLIA